MVLFAQILSVSFSSNVAKSSPGYYGMTASKGGSRRHWWEEFIDVGSIGCWSPSGYSCHLVNSLSHSTELMSKERMTCWDVNDKK